MNRVYTGLSPTENARCRRVVAMERFPRELRRDFYRSA